MGTGVSSPAVAAGSTGTTPQTRMVDRKSAKSARAGGSRREKQWWASAWVDTGEESTEISLQDILARAPNWMDGWEKTIS